MSFLSWWRRWSVQRSPGRRDRRYRAWRIDDLEARLLLSAAYTPAQISHAYGFDQIMFGSVKGDGTGQTIAIVDAYDAPNIASDLAVFNATFGLPTTDGNGGTLLTKVYASGSAPAYNSTWAMETTLDVQWAHAIAPGAKILLVEAASSGLSDLLTAVNYAKNQPGVSVVSMSWGSSEMSFETLYDSYFTTPSGHQGVSFVASAGDVGATTNYPSTSINVLAVGGTALSTSDGLGTWSSETVWSGTGGGISSYESKPTWQAGVTQSATKRTVPDVAYNADPNTGVQIYFSGNSGSGSWTTVGGTSAGAPQWAALVAIANQGRALAGLDTLNGGSQLLPAIYNMPASNFHDITSGSSGFAAGPGYDLATGRGSPYANLVVSDLVRAAADGSIPAVADMIGTVTASAQSGSLTYGSSGSATYTVTVTRSGSGAFDVDLSLISGLPSGANYTWTVGGTTTNSLHFGASDNSLTATLTITSATKSAAGSFSFTVQADRVDASHNPTGDLATGNGALAIAKRTLTVSAAGINRAYDGTTLATVNLSDDRLSGDLVTINYGSATFGDKNVGSGKAVSVSGISLSGSDAGNYQLAGTTASTTATITARALTGSITASSRVYDGTNAASIASRSLSGVVSGDSVSYVGGTATFGDKNVGSGKTVSATGLSLSGADAGNYTVSSSATTTANITARSLTATIAASDKVYDGTTSAAITSYGLSGVLAGETVNVGGGTATFNNKNVGTGKTVTATGLVLSGPDAGNYSVNPSATTTASVTAKVLTGTVTISSKVYDGTVSATIASRSLTGVVAGDTVSYTGGSAAFGDDTVGTAKTAVASGLGLSGADAANYTVNTSAQASGNITAKTLTISVAATGKVYDGTAAVTVNLSDNRISGDVLSVGYVNAAFADKNVGAAKTVTVSGLSLSGADSGNYQLAGTTATTTAAITARSLTGSVTAIAKVYDGTTAAVLASRTLSGVLAGDTVSYVGGTATFASKNVGTGKTVTATGLSLSGADAGNYTVNTTATTSADVTARTLTISAAGVNRVYDGTTTATVNLSDNRVSGDALTLSYSSAAFADKNVASGKSVAVSGISVSGADAGNYQLAATTANTTASITAKSLTGTVTASNKVYDGTTTATIASRSLTGVVAGDTVNYVGGTATFVSKTAGTGKTVTATGLGLSGADAGNYTVNSSATTTANITARTLTVSATGVNRVYDATTGATVTLSDDRVSGDTLTVTYASAAFANKNVGSGKAVSVTGISVSGADAANYQLAATTASTTAAISAKSLTGTITAANKTYDGSSSATIASRTLSGVIAGDSVSYAGGTATFGDKNVGTGKTVTATGLGLSGVDAGNYTVNAGATATATVTPMALTGSVTVSNKTYDGTTSATIVSRSLPGVVSGDAVSYTGGTATFDTKNVGTGKTVTVTGLSLSGADAGNYTVNTTATTTAAVSARTLTVSAAGVGRAYDGTNVATVTLSDNRVAGDALTLGYGSATFADKNVGAAKAVSVSGITISGADAGNYQLAATTTTTTAGITAKALTGAITAADKTYDGTTAATILTRSLTGVVAGDAVALIGGTATFGGKNVGNGKTVTASGLSLSGADAGNYTVGSTATTTASVTALAITVTADPQTKTQGSADPTLTYQVTSGSLVGGDAFTGSLTRAAGESAGVYAIQAGTLWAGNNYTLTFVGNNLTITASDPAPLSISFDLSGPWFVGGKLAQVAQTGTALSFTDENGAVSSGSFSTTSQLTGRGGLTGAIDVTTADQGRILWSDGAIWVRLSLGGQYYNPANGRLTSVAQDGMQLTFTNASGGTTTGTFLSPTQVSLTSWGQTAVFDNGALTMSGGSTWAKLDLSPTYTTSNGGMAVGAIQNGTTTLSFVNRLGQVSSGYWLTPTSVFAVDWNSTGVVSNGQISWNGGQTVWNKNLLALGASSGQGQISITETNNQITLTNKAGATSHAYLVDANTIVSVDWGGVVGTRSGGRIIWANGTIWDSFDLNALDAVFADIHTFPFGA